jgi:hypothetical protein
MSRELRPSKQKSFYGKAILADREDGTVELQSFGKTIAVSKRGGGTELIPPYDWRSLSATSRRHLLEFNRQYGRDRIHSSKGEGS